MALALALWWVAVPLAGDVPLNATPAWRERVAQLEAWRRGGPPPPPLVIGALDGRRERVGRFPKSVNPIDPRWRGIIGQAGRRHGVDPALITAVIMAESNFNAAAVSHKGAQGVMQIMPATGRDLGLADFFDPVANTDAGARYLAALLKEFPRLDLAIAAYNAGPAAVRRNGGRIPPSRETVEYVSRVLASYHRLAAEPASRR